MDRFELTDVQAQAIVDMRLRALTGLEREKLEAEYAELMERSANSRQSLQTEMCFFVLSVRKSLQLLRNTAMTEELPSD